MEFWSDIAFLATEGPPPTEHAPFNAWTTIPWAIVVFVAGWWAIRRYRLPFVGRVFWKTLPATYLGAGLIWGAVLVFTEYKLMPADYGGTIISAAILSYLIHLWLIPIDELPGNEGEGPPGPDSGSDVDANL